MATVNILSLGKPITFTFICIVVTKLYVVNGNKTWCVHNNNKGNILIEADAINFAFFYINNSLSSSMLDIQKTLMHSVYEFETFKAFKTIETFEVNVTLWESKILNLNSAL